MYQVIFSIHRDREPDISQALFDLGAGSVSSFPGNGEDVSVIALFSSLDSVKEHFPEGRYAVRYLHEKEWKYSWLDDYHGFAVNDDIYIHPFPCSATAPEDYRYVIRLDPRDAFGDGRHPTTRLCMLALHRILTGYTDEKRAGISMLDAGTGTGILSVLASMLGVRNIDAVDIDMESIRRARSNAERNRCSINFHEADISSFHGTGTYNLVTANLLTGIFFDTLPGIANLLGSDGTLIASGVSSTWDNDISAVFRKHGLTILENMDLDGWHCYLLSFYP